MSPASTGSRHSEPQRHVLVLDCNVFLDVARVLGPPFAWAKFDREVARIARHPVPHPDDPQLDSLRVVAMCTSGRFAGDEPVEVWTNSHIERIVLGKAMQSTTPDPVTGYRGLGWSREDAETLVSVLIEELTTWSNGGTLGASHMPDGTPPLDHEDGMVYGACRSLSGQDPLARVYCVTRDRSFIDDFRQGRLGDHTTVLPPAKLVMLMRAARATHAAGAMRPRDVETRAPAKERPAHP